MTPRLRFPGFIDEWQTNKLGDVAERVTRRNSENNQNILTISAQRGLVGQEKFFTKIVAAKNVKNYYLLHKNEYAYNKSYSKGYPMGAIKRLIHDEKGVVSTLYICFRFKDQIELFFDQYIESGNLNPEIEKIAQEGARNHGLLNMGVSDFFAIHLRLPSEAEQERIAEFLTVVDERIEKQGQKVELLKKYKKGVTQKIFTQQRRFKNTNGAQYPDWSEESLRLFLQVSKNKSAGKVDKNRILTVKLHRKGVAKSTNVDSLSIGATTYYVRRAGDLIYGKQNLFNGAIALIPDVLDGSLSSGDIPSLRINKSIINPEYLLEYLGRKDYYKKLESIASGSGSKRIHENTLLDQKINLPTLAEQQKIATLLNVLDDRIKVEEAGLVALKQWKKGLLKKMFV